MIKNLLMKYRDSFSLFLLGVSILSLGGAYTAEYGFGLKPCELCLYQRIPYAAVIVLAFVMLLSKKCSCTCGILKALCGLIFAAGAALAFFHVGVEHHWWQGLEGCSGGGLAQTIEDLRSQILGAPAVRCDQPAFVFLGISMAGYNALWSAALAALTFYSVWLDKVHGKTSAKK